VFAIAAVAQGQQQRTNRGAQQATRQLIVRIESRTVEFRENLQRSLNRRSTNTQDRNEDPFQLVSDYSEAVRRLHERFDARQATATDAQEVLNRAATIDEYIRRNPVDAATQTSWSTMRVDLNQLGNTYSVSWPQSTRIYPRPGSRFGNGLTGTFRLDGSRSDDARAMAERATRQVSQNDRQRMLDSLMRRLESPEQIAIDVRGRTVMIASTRAPQITFEADGTNRTERRPSGRVVTSRATLTGQQLVVSSTGDAGNDFSVTFEAVDNGQNLSVTRSVYMQGLTRPVVVRSVYEKTAQVAQFDVYNQQQQPDSNPSGSFVIRDGDVVVGVLDEALTTRTAAVGDRFTMRVTQPIEYEGATVEGHVSNVQRSGRLTGRSVLTLDFDNIRLRDGRSYRFAGTVEGVRTPGGDTVKVDNEGAVRDDNQTNKTVERTAIGTGIGAIIGAIVGGGKGAAIGAVVGAGGGAGSVYVQGRDDLDLARGSELTIRAGAPASTSRR